MRRNGGAPRGEPGFPRSGAQIDIADIRRLAAFCRSEELAVFEIESSRFRLKLRFDPTVATPSGDRIVPVVAGRDGRFLRRHPALPAPFVAPGEAVREGDILGLVAAGSIYLPVAAPTAGRVAEIEPADGEAVQRGARVMQIAASR